MSEYKIIELENNTYIQKTDENGQVWAIPTDSANSDYAEYLASLEEPNLPEVKETPETSEAE
jgi:hypothetical protein